MLTHRDREEKWRMGLYKVYKIEDRPSGVKKRFLKLAHDPQWETEPSHVGCDECYHCENIIMASVSLSTNETRPVWYFTSTN